MTTHDFLIKIGKIGQLYFELFIYRYVNGAVRVKAFIVRSIFLENRS